MKLSDKLPEDVTLRNIIIQIRKLKKGQKLLKQLFDLNTYTDESDDNETKTNNTNDQQ